MRRRLVALGLLLALVALAGCSSVFGGGGPSDQQLNKNATYDWDTNATTTISLSRSSFSAVVGVENESWVKLYRSGALGDKDPISIRALRFRYPNGTVVRVNESAMDVSTGGSKTNVTLPQAGGQVAFKANRPTGKRFSTPLFVDGKHSIEATLPPGARVGIPFFSQVSPGASDRWVDDNRMTIRWDSTKNGPLVLRYYLARDLYIFGGLAVVLLIVGGGGVVYYLRQIRTLEQRREDIGLDVDVEDDDLDDGPPPGMR
jgi:hypothetical protein